MIYLFNLLGALKQIVVKLPSPKPEDPRALKAHGSSFLDAMVSRIYTECDLGFIGVLLRGIRHYTECDLGFVGV